MEYLTRIIAIENGKPVFSNEISDAKIVGEIRLQKYPPDNICNICLHSEVLTHDHVPPQCMGNEGLFHYVNYYNYIRNKEIKYFGICRNGIKYQTICEKCNKEKLKIYDDAISTLYSNFRNTSISNKLSLRLRVKPNKIIRGILGHFLSAKTSHERTEMENIFAEAIDYPDKPINNNLGFYVAPYLSEQIRVIRDLIVNGNIVLNSLKINPLAFIVTFPKVSLDFTCWDQFFNCNPDSEYELEFFGTKECELEFPERTLPLLLGKNSSESIIGFPQNESIT